MSNYPSPPAARMAYDRDGSVGFWYQASGGQGLTQLTSGQMLGWNRENNATWINFPNYNPTTFGVIFPELRDIAGYYFGYMGQPGAMSSGSFQTSTNTTNGLDGTWTVQDASFASHASGGYNTPPTSTQYRTSIFSIAVSGVKAVQFQWSSANNLALYNMHLYGSLSVGQSADKLAIWDPTLDQPLPYIDWGDVQRTTSSSVNFRVKNMSASKTAHSPQVSMYANSDAPTASLPPQFLFNLASATPNTPTSPFGLPADLGPGIISAPITVTRTTPSNADLGIWACWLQASATSFS